MAQEGKWDPSQLFRRGKEDAARKALQGALEGKENLLQELEQRSAKEAQAEAGGGSGGGRQDFWRLLTGGGGGGDGEWDPRKKLAKHKQTLQAVIFLVAGVAAFFLWKPALAFLVNLIFFCLRIPDGRDASLQINYDLTAEEDVIRRWGEHEEDWNG